jgi:hypothetical protein
VLGRINFSGYKKKLSKSSYRRTPRLLPALRGVNSQGTVCSTQRRLVPNPLQLIYSARFDCRGHPRVGLTRPGDCRGFLFGGYNKGDSATREDAMTVWVQMPRHSFGFVLLRYSPAFDLCLLGVSLLSHVIAPAVSGINSQRQSP